SLLGLPISCRLLLRLPVRPPLALLAAGQPAHPRHGHRARGPRAQPPPPPRTISQLIHSEAPAQHPLSPSHLRIRPSPLPPRARCSPAVTATACRATARSASPRSRPHSRAASV